MVGFKVKYNYWEVGSASFLHAFFSTVAYHLEKGQWGKKYPVIMSDLYQGKLSCDNVPAAKKELEQIKNQLTKYSPDKVIWDIEDLSKQPPWGDKISDSITDLSNYFVTSDGRDFIEILNRAMDIAIEIHSDLEIKSI